MAVKNYSTPTLSNVQCVKAPLKRRRLKIIFVESMTEKNVNVMSGESSSDGAAVCRIISSILIIPKTLAAGSYTEQNR